MRILVTGSSGQIGSYVVDACATSRHDVVGVDIRPSLRTDIVGDICEPSVGHRVAEGVDAVIHCAAHVSVQASVEHPAWDAKNNVLGTVQVMEAARDHGATTFVNLSSAAVYGAADELPISESNDCRPLSPYAVGKLTTETYGRIIGDLSGLKVISVRPFNVYSPRQDADSPYSGVLSVFANRVQQNLPPVVFGGGEQTRDFIHAVDVASWLVGLATSPPVHGTVVNLGSGHATSIRDLAHCFIELAGLSCEPEQGPGRPGEILHSVADTVVARGLGLVPSIDLEQGIRELLAHVS